MRIKARCQRVLSRGMKLAITRAHVNHDMLPFIGLNSRPPSFCPRFSCPNVPASNRMTMTNQHKTLRSRRWAWVYRIHAITEKDAASFCFVIIADSVATSPALRRWVSGVWTQLDLLCITVQTCKEKGADYFPVCWRMTAVSAVKSHHYYCKVYGDWIFFVLFLFFPLLLFWSSSNNNNNWQQPPLSFHLSIPSSSSNNLGHSFTITSLHHVPSPLELLSTKSLFWRVSHSGLHKPQHTIAYKVPLIY